MSTEPEWPKLVKPDSITEAEWQVWSNTRVELMPPGLHDKVRAALNITRENGVATGHVPDFQLARYRSLMNMSRQFKSLGDTIGANDMADSTICWRLAKKYQDKAQQLRADLPNPPPEETP